MGKSTETRWVVVKDYTTQYGDNCTDTWCILYGTKAEADAAMARLEAGQDKSFYDTAGSDYAGYEAFLYVDQITL